MSEEFRAGVVYGLAVAFFIVSMTNFIIVLARLMLKHSRERDRAVIEALTQTKPLDDIWAQLKRDSEGKTP